MGPGSQGTDRAMAHKHPYVSMSVHAPYKHWKGMLFWEIGVRDFLSQFNSDAVTRIGTWPLLELQLG